VIINGSDTRNLFILNNVESLTIHPPQNKLIAKKCTQNKIKNDLSENKLDRSSKPKYRLKFISRL
jgi:hypothetical protein